MELKVYTGFYDRLLVEYLNGNRLDTVQKKEMFEGWMGSNRMLAYIIIMYALL